MCSWFWHKSGIGASFNSKGAFRKYVNNFGTGGLRILVENKETLQTTWVELRYYQDANAKQDASWFDHEKGDIVYRGKGYSAVVRLANIE